MILFRFLYLPKITTLTEIQKELFDMQVMSLKRETDLRVYSLAARVLLENYIKNSLPKKTFIMSKQ